MPLRHGAAPSIGMPALLPGSLPSMWSMCRNSACAISAHCCLRRAPGRESHPGGTPGRPAAPDIESVVLELQRSLDYYERHFDQPPITRIAVSPSGKRASLLAADLGGETGFQVETLDLS